MGDGDTRRDPATRTASALCVLVLAALVAAGCGTAGRGPGSTSGGASPEPTIPGFGTDDGPASLQPSASLDPSAGGSFGVGEPTETDEGQEGEACRLLTQKEVESALGESLSEPVPTGSEACEYTSADAGSIVEVRLAPGSAVHTGIRNAFPGAEAVPKLGEEAYWVPRLMVLSVLLEEQTLQIQLTVGDELAPKAKDAAVKLVRAALGRL